MYSHRRRSRPTLRVLQEDLASGWASPAPRRILDADRFEDLHPLSELPHPIISKAAESFSDDDDADNPRGLIRSSPSIPLHEIKIQQWRGAVWEDPETGVHWLVKAGLAKGGHNDTDDFYQQIERAEQHNTITTWLPVAIDRRLLRQESAAFILSRWERGLQAKVQAVLSHVGSGGQSEMRIQHPVENDSDIASALITVCPVRDEDYSADEIVVEVDTDDAYKASDLEWTMITRILTAIHPPVQAWDRFRNSFSTIDVPGAWINRAELLTDLNSHGELAELQPGAYRHYSHKPHIADSSVNGAGIRALCGIFFVPHEDHAALPMCPDCSARWSTLPRHGDLPS